MIPHFRTGKIMDPVTVQAFMDLSKQSITTMCVFTASLKVHKLSL